LETLPFRQILNIRESHLLEQHFLSLFSRPWYTQKNNSMIHQISFEDFIQGTNFELMIKNKIGFPSLNQEQTLSKSVLNDGFSDESRTRRNNIEYRSCYL
jgi:hypothetical protein